MSTILEAESVGPVDVAVIRFGDDQWDGKIASAIGELQRDGVVRIIDLSFVRKDSEGVVSAVEVADSEVAARYEELADAELDLLSDEDLGLIARGLEPGSAALVVVWENTWAARLTSALRSHDSEVVMLERIPHQVVALALDALREGETS